jgi:hypothetical protein
MAGLSDREMRSAKKEKANLDVRLFCAESVVGADGLEPPTYAV